MNNRIVIFASTPTSHIIPIEPLVKYLVKLQYEIHCFSHKKNKLIIQQMGMIFHEYSKGIYNENKVSETNIYLEEVARLWDENKMIEGYDLFAKKDTEYMYNITNKQIFEMIAIIKTIDPFMLFRDSADKVGYYVGIYTKIPVIGYITNNLYSKQYFEQNPKYLYSLFMNANIAKYNYLLNYFADYRKKLEKINYEVAKNKGVLPLNTFHQFDPMNKFTIIFSTDLFQPKESLSKERNYSIVYPLQERFKIEDSIPADLIDFLNEKNGLIIYIASGSIISNNIGYYINYIYSFRNVKCKVIISCYHHYELLKKCIEDNGISNILVKKFIPQKYVLSKADLFITSGGQNSILEAIYYKVPMLIDPITSEQRLNGIQLEKMGIGYTSVNINRASISRKNIIKILLYSKTIRKNLKKYSNDIKQHTNDFSEINKFILEYSNMRG